MKKFKEKLILSLAPILFGFLLTVIYDLIKGHKFLSTITYVLHAIGNAIITFLCLKIQLWWIIIGICSVILILYIISKISSKNDNFKPDFISYTEDNFRTWKWSWYWELNSYKKGWEVSDLVAHCPKCDTPMLCDTSEDIFQCPRCHFESEYNNHDKSYEVNAVIIDNIKRKKKSGI